jgi:hypothetical protein
MTYNCTCPAGLGGSYCEIITPLAYVYYNFDELPSSATVTDQVRGWNGTVVSPATFSPAKVQTICSLSSHFTHFTHFLSSSLFFSFHVFFIKFNDGLTMANGGYINLNNLDIPSGVRPHLIIYTFYTCVLLNK